MNVEIQSYTLSTVIAQISRGVGSNAELGSSLIGGAIGAFLTTVIVGAIMIAFVPQYTERMMNSVADNPVGSFVYGIIFLFALGFVTLILVITIIGIFFAVPLVLIAFIVWAIGAVIGYLAIADRLIGRSDGWLQPLLLGGAINGALTLTGIGGIIAFGIGAAGFGAILRNALS